ATLHRALALNEATPERLGGIAAGDARRWCDLSHQLAVVVASDDVDAVVARFNDLPEIVSIAARAPGGALVGTVARVPIELVVARAHELGTALLRATGSADYVAA